MRIVKKILMSAAVVSAVAAMAAVSANAEMTAIYNSDGTVTLRGITTQAEDKTLLVLTEDTTDISGTKAASVKDGGIIVQIDQDTTIGTKNVVVGELVAGKTYYVRVGGDTNFEQAQFTVPGGTTPHTVLVGDANGDEEVGASDAAQIALYAVSSPVTTVIDNTDTFYAAAYCNGDAEVGAADAAQVALYSVSSPAANALVNTLVEVGSIGTTN